MVYERVQKNSSSWNPAVPTESPENQFKPRSFVVPPQKNQNSSPPSEIQAPHTASSVFSTSNVNIQTQTTPEGQKFELESPETENKLKKDAIKLQGQGESGESGNNDSDLSANGGTIQRLASKFSTEQQEGNKEETTLQTKLTIGAPGDKYEQEADSMAEQVMSMDAPTATNSPTIQSDSEAPFDSIQQQPLVQSIHPLIQRQVELNVSRQPIMSISPLIQRQIESNRNSTQTRPIIYTNPFIQRFIHRAGGNIPSQENPSLESRLASQKGSGSPLDEQTRSFMEPRFGNDFSSVRVHTDSSSVQMNQELGAQAFTHGSDVYFGAGKYNPGVDDGKRLLAHELTHVVQQTGAVQPKSNPHQAFKQNKIQTKALFTSSPEAQSVIQSKKQGSQESTKQNRQEPIKEEQQHLQESVPVADVEPEKEQPAKNQDRAKEPATEKSSDGAAVAPQVKIQGEADSNSTAIAPPVEIQGEADSTKAPATGKTSSSAAKTTGGTKAAASPQKDPEFQAVVNNAKGVTAENKKHEPAQVEAQEAQDAAQPPSNEVESKAQDQQVQEMDQQPPGEFNAAAFKQKVMDKVNAVAPNTLEEADKFKDSNLLNSVGGDLSSQAQEATAQATGPVTEKTQAAPDSSGIEPKAVKPLENPEVGPQPPDIGAAKATPKPKPEAEVSAPLTAESQKLDQQMAEAEVTEEQLANSNEPQFINAVGAKKSAQTKVVEAPQAYRQQEQATLNQAQTEAQTTSQTQLEGMHGQREQLLAQVSGHQDETKTKDEQARAKIATDIDGIYQQTKSDVEGVLNGLDTEVTNRFKTGADTAKKKFEEYVAPQMSEYKKRYEGFWGAGRWVKDELLGVPSEVTAFFTQGRELYLAEIDQSLTDISQYVVEQLTTAKEKIHAGRQKIQDYVNALPEALQQVGVEAAQNIQSDFDQLEQSVQDKETELVDQLTQQYSENLQELDSQIQEMKASNQPWFAQAFDAMAGAIESINKLKDMLLGVLAKAASAVGSIIKDPIGFLGNLVTGLRQGFENFAGKIETHLQTGLVGWLTGACGAMGIQLPEDIFSLPGIFSLVTQMLGLSWNYIRTKGVKLFGEPVMAGMEKGSEILPMLMSGDFMGMWEHVKADFTDLKETVIAQIKDMVITQVITAGVKWIIGLLNPASAFVKAAMAIYDIVMFFINSGSQIMDLVNSIIDAVGAIASGAVSGAAKLVENALAKSLPVVISFLASLLGVGNLAKKVQAIVEKIRQRIDQAIDKLLLKAKNLFKGKGKKGKDDKDIKEGKIDVPKSLAASKMGHIEQPPQNLIQEAAKTSSGTVIYQASVKDPKQATKKLLKEHPDAKLNDKTDVLTLPPLQSATFNGANSLKTLGNLVAKQTGLTQIIFNKSQTGWSLNGKLNPTIAGLVTYAGAPPSLDPLIQEIKGHEMTINPSKEFFKSICTEAAKRHGASVDFKEKRDTSVKPHRPYTEVTFSQGTPSGATETFVSEIVSVSDNTCPACDADSGITRPHNVIPASMWKKVIHTALTNFNVSISLGDPYIGKISAAGTSTKGPAVTEDKQCRKCEDNQDKHPGPYSLLQRRAGQLAGFAGTVSHPNAPGKSSGDLFTGSQFKNTTQAQLEQFTKDKIDQVVEQIQKILSTVPANHTLYANITSDPTTQAAFLQKIRTDALAAAQASPAAYPP
ncbi:eCIS core domain-containing protein [Anabaena sp. CCY 0017]|uniref:eCIS core domain-containing protein n=1 Tax=Anabaena sp. CCY 0017 TaxID=3103866 RepID=UPI0039C688CE